MRKQQIEKCFNVPEVAKRYRMGEDKVRQLIRRGIIKAVDIGNGGVGRSSVRITPEALLEFEKTISVKTTDENN